MTQTRFPPLALEAWQATRDTLATYSRLTGNIRRAFTPPQKHWWHVSLRVAATGLTTTPIPAGNQTFELLLDFTTHELIITTSHGARRKLPLTGQAPASFHDATLAALAELEIKPEIDRSAFDAETEGAYDATAVADFWQALTQIDAALKAFRHGFRGESSPVQLWPHHFDLAVVWFSGRLVPDQDPNDPEYADEQMNFGFSTGDDGIPEPYFYATAYPTPPGFTDARLPDGAYWQIDGWTGAVLPYATLVGVENPHSHLRTFLETAHAAGAEAMQTEPTA